MTFQQYIDNPLGKKNAVFSQRDIYRTQYTKKFDAVYLREAGQISYFLYKDKKSDSYFAHIKVPSEVVPKFYYDVVIKFSTTDNAVRGENTLKNYDVRFFSNDPAFVFTFAYVFRKNDMFVEELKERASKRSLKEFPKEKNAFGIPGYVKSIYFAWLYINRKNLLSKTLYDQYGKPYNRKELVASVGDTDEKIAQRQELGEEVRKKEAFEKRAKDNAAISNAKSRQAAINGYYGDDTHRIKVTDTSKVVKPVSKIKQAQKAKKVTRIGRKKQWLFVYYSLDTRSQEDTTQ